MSRSLRALTEGCARTVSVLRGLGNRAKDRRDSGSSDRIGAAPPLTLLKWMAVTGVVVLAFAPATALGKTSHRQPRIAQLKTHDAGAPARATAPRMQILAPGAGYADVHGSASVRALQRKLARAGFGPGPIDGLYGPRTEHAVIKFQAAHALQVDGIAGPHTFAALRSGRLRATTRSARAVTRSRTATTRRRTAPIGAQRSARRRPANGRPTVRSNRNATRRAIRAPGSSLPMGWIVLIAALGGAVLFAAIAGTRLRRRAEPHPAGPGNPEPDGNGKPTPITPETSSGARLDAEYSNDARDAFSLAGLLEQQGDIEGALAAYRQAVALGHLGAACNLGVLLEEQHDIEGAEAAYRRSAQGGDPNGAFNHAGLLERRGALDEAIAAYRRADRLGHAAAACNLGVLLEEQGDLEGAEAAYRRADAGGDASGTFNLGIVLERRGDVAAALAAFQRAASIGPPDVRSAAHAVAAELSAGVNRPSALERGGIRHG